MKGVEIKRKRYRCYSVNRIFSLSHLAQEQGDKDKISFFLSFDAISFFDITRKANWVFRERENVQEFNRWIEQDNVISIFNFRKLRIETRILLNLFDSKHYKYPFLRKRENHRYRWRNTRQIIFDISSTQFNATNLDTSKSEYTGTYPR